MVGLVELVGSSSRNSSVYQKGEPGLARPMFGPRRLFNTYRGLMLEFVLDGHGNIITVFF